MKGRDGSSSRDPEINKINEREKMVQRFCIPEGYKQSDVGDVGHSVEA